MNDRLAELLSGLSPAEPSAGLDARVRMEFAGRRLRRRRRLVLHCATVATAVCAVIAGVVALNRSGDAPLAPPRDTASAVAVGPAAAPLAVDPAASPVRVELGRSILVDHGVIVLADNTPVRQYRRQTLRRVVWHDAARNVHVESWVPRQEVVLLREATY